MVDDDRHHPDGIHHLLHTMMQPVDTVQNQPTQVAVEVGPDFSLEWDWVPWAVICSAEIGEEGMVDMAMEEMDMAAVNIGTEDDPVPVMVAIILVAAVIMMGQVHRHHRELHPGALIHQAVQILTNSLFTINVKMYSKGYGGTSRR
jgi:hypothetical protein